MPANCAVLRLQIAPERIYFLKFILEGYDGLALMSTLDRKQGLVELRYPAEMKKELLALLDDLGPKLLQENQLDLNVTDE